MADNDSSGSASTAIVAIVAIAAVIFVIYLLMQSGMFGPKTDNNIVIPIPGTNGSVSSN